MRRWIAPLLFTIAAVVIVSGDAPRASAQPKAAPPVEETFLTADGVQLRGLFHASAQNPGSAPVVILMYPPGKDAKGKEQDMTQGDWVGLANKLSIEGYHVFRFDWRGHGKNGSDIKDTEKFWNLTGKNPFTGPWNAKYITGANKKPIKSDLYFKDFKGQDPARYAPVFLLDLAAVRHHLDNKNDAGELNTSSIYLIGSGNAATIGMAWIATEWHRPATVPNPNQLAVPGGLPTYVYVPQPINNVNIQEAGNDIAGTVWLSANHPSSISENQIKAWVARFAPKMRDNNPMLFMYAEKDNPGKRASEFFFNEVLVGKGDMRLGLTKLNEKYLHEIKGANNLSGVALLGNNAALKTEDTIVNFLTAIQKEKAKLIRKQRGFAAPWYIQLPSFGITGP
jgi:hypothetical protein